MKTFIRITALAVLVCGAGCSNKNFQQIDPQQKAKMVSTTSVLGNGTSPLPSGSGSGAIPGSGTGTGNGEIPVTGSPGASQITGPNAPPAIGAIGTGSTTGIGAPTATGPLSVDQGVSVTSNPFLPVNYMCSKTGTARVNNLTLKSAASVDIELVKDEYGHQIPITSVVKNLSLPHRFFDLTTGVFTTNGDYLFWNANAISRYFDAKSGEPLQRTESDELNCHVSGAFIRQDLINTKTLNMGKIYDICVAQNSQFDLSGQYRMDIISYGQGMMAPSNGLYIETNKTYVQRTSEGYLPKHNFYGGNVNINTDVANSAAVLWAGYGQAIPVYSSGVAGVASHFDLTGGEGCDQASSPLVISLVRGNQPSIQLLPPLDGIYFDLLGSNSLPVPHTKVLTSWLAKDSLRDNYFIVLPDPSGQVRGIDELFGDNTVGPDGYHSRNGFEALAKHDHNRDRFITADDRVFAKLRLWSDVNGDGIAQSGELHHLGALGVEMIDLGFDPNFREVDKYGNELRFKSVAKMKDGSLKMVFDLWFRHL